MDKRVSYSNYRAHCIRQLSNCDVSWIVKDGYLGNTFFDASSTAFILPTFESTGRTVRVWNEGCAPVEPSPLRHDGAATAARVGMGGSGLGPEWLRRARERSVLLESLGEGVAGSADSPQHTLDIHFYDSVRSIDDSAGGAITIHTTQGQVSRQYRHCRIGYSILCNIDAGTVV